MAKNPVAILREIALVRGSQVKEAHKVAMIEQLELALDEALAAAKADRVVVPKGESKDGPIGAKKV